MRVLPIGKADFAYIRQNGGYYADKTDLLYKLAQWQIPYFLSRPRRFGKSLLVNTLECILKGQRELFKGLWIDSSDYDWTPYPVISLDMNGVVGNDLADLEQNLTELLEDLAVEFEIELKPTKPANMFRRLIMRLYNKSKQKVAVLIDEYDAPIVKHINDSAKADKFRDFLKDFYGVLKTNVTKIGHIFVTGVSRFTKTSIFSELNNLRDITLDREFACICGLTGADLEDLIAERGERTLKTLTGLKDMSEGSDVNDLRSLIDQWYDGYSWDGLTRVYNPWSVLNFFASAKFIGHWYDTGTPTFLMELVSSGKIRFDLSAEIPTISDSDNVIDKIDSLDPAIMMFQTGYLTIGERLQPATSGGSPSYRLTLPNLEVKAAFVPLLLSLKAPKEPLTAKIRADETRDSLLRLNAEGFERAFHLFLEQHVYDDNNQNEKHYHSLFVSAMTIAGQPLIPHEHTAHGILDIRLKGHDGDEFIIEVKVLNEKGKTESAVPPDTSGKTARNTQGKKPVPRYLGLPVTDKEKTSLRKRMTTLAKRALRQIDAKYADKFVGRGARLIKVALVIARRSYVLVKFDVVDSHGA